MIEALRDFWFIHADVFRNALVMLFLLATDSVITTLVNRWRYRMRAMKEAREDLKQKVVELQIVCAERDKQLVQASELIQKLATDRRSAEALGKAIGEAVKP